MQFRDLQKQYQVLKKEIDKSINEVLTEGNFIMGRQVYLLEEQLASYTDSTYCLTCANGTDALKLALMAWDVKKGDAVFVPDFTFFSSGEVVADLGATPVFIDVDEKSYNLSGISLESSIKKVLSESSLNPKAIISVDLFGLPADYTRITQIARSYGLLLLEDGAQGFGGSINNHGIVKRACSFGDISTTSFFPAKPLGCYGDGGAIFTNNKEWAETIESLKIHGKGSNKYDNVRIGMNSRLDTIQAAILLPKLNAFKNYELAALSEIANYYNSLLKDYVETPVAPENFSSAWAQYTIKLEYPEKRKELIKFLDERGIPSAVYYTKPMHKQNAFQGNYLCFDHCPETTKLCSMVLSLPIHPYMGKADIEEISKNILDFFKK